MAIVQYALHTAEGRADPYPHYARARAEGRILFNGPLLAGWAITDYALIAEALRDSRLSAQRMSADALVERARGWTMPEADIRAWREWRHKGMLFTDPPDHGRLRGLVAKAFTPRMIERLRADIQDVVDDILDRVEPRGEMDVIRDLAFPLPAIIIVRLLGLPESDLEEFKRWSDDIAGPTGGYSEDILRRAYGAQRAAAAYLRVQLAQRKGGVVEDLLAALMAAEEHGDVLTEEELFSNALLLLAAGHETTMNLIGNGVLALLRNQGQLDLLRRQPELCDNAVEELLRFDSPVQATARTARAPVEIAGNVIQPGESVVLVLAAANRDPTYVSNPDMLDITRKDIQHLSFAYGPHYCLGAPLARLEAQIVFSTMLRRFPRLRLASDNIEWGENFVLRGVKQLNVVF